VSTAVQRRRTRARLLQLVTGCWSTQALRVAVEMDLPDRLAAGPLSPQALAAEANLHPDGLRRLLRALCALDVCRERRDGRFVLGAAGEVLRRAPPDAEPSLRSVVQWWGGPMWSLWPDLGYSVRTGASARQRRTGQQGYGFLESEPGMAATFHDAMHAMTALVAADVARLALWQGIRSLVDVGGGNGALAAAVVAAHPHLQGLVLDRSDAEPAARALLGAQGVAARCRVAVGDFFTALPAGQDAYLLKSILHNWDDAACARILAHCARAAAPGARLVVVERLSPARLRRCAHDNALARTDLNMLVGLGGRERTRPEFAALLAEAGFELAAVHPTAFEFSVLEARRR
jgi:SAM-dependent methyltransferase